MKTSRLLPYAILAVVAGVAAPADEKPNFTGVWELIAIERDGTTLPAGPDTFEETQVWSHEEPKLTIKMTSRGQGDTRYVTELSYALDGKRAVVGHRVRADNRNPPINGFARWDGNRVVYEQELVNPAPGAPRRIVRACSLGEKGHWLTCEQTYWLAGSNRQLEAKWRFEKTRERP